MISLQRLSDTPILSPIPHHPWEAAAVFNSAAILHDSRVHLIYRATNVSSNGRDGVYINNLGYAVSDDGVHFERREKPILVNDIDQELRGPEDPRIVSLDDIFYMTYTGFGGRFDGDYRISLASSHDLIHWERHGVLMDEPNKDAALFPERISGRYAMLHRRPPDIWIGFSDDLRQWNSHIRIMEPRPDSTWENEKIGAAGPPLRIDSGWLLIYHGVNREKHYSLGVALLDADDPTQVIHRQLEPILEPSTDWEVHGYVPNVVFSCGHVVMNDRLLVYYGGADTAIGVAAIDLTEMELR